VASRKGNPQSSAASDIEYRFLTLARHQAVIGTYRIANTTFSLGNACFARGFLQGMKKLLATVEALRSLTKLGGKVRRRLNRVQMGNRAIAEVEAGQKSGNRGMCMSAL
jgi:hypothetical protein